MNERTARSMYYIDGSAVRKMEAVPDRERVPASRPDRRPSARPNVRPEERTGRRPEVKRRISQKADRALAFNARYTVFVASAVFIMVAACIAMLYMETRISNQQNNINNLETELEAIQNDNAAYKMTLDNMYTIDDIYDIATNELGMVYAKKGQIIYYDSADEDYVKQYKDVPEAN